MKKKVDCEVTDMTKRIISILTQPVSETDGSGSSIGIKELRGMLGKDFEFSTEELARAINLLAANSQIVLVCGRGRKDDDDLVVSSVLSTTVTQ